MTGQRVLGPVLLAGVLAGSGFTPRAGPATVPGDAATTTVEPLRLVLNLPAYRLDVYEFGERTVSYRVAVGKATHRTPRGQYRISSVEWNPWWHPPPSPWARGMRPAAPGPRNPMGRAKLYFQDLYFIHGTPALSSLGSAASHGCVRMSNPDVIELARLVHRHGSPEVSRTELDRLEASPRQTRRIRLSRPVPLEIRYDLVEARQGVLHLHRDIYGVGSRALVREQVMQAVVRLGEDPRRVDRERVEELLALAGRGSVAIPLETLLADPPVPVGS